MPKKKKSPQLNPDEEQAAHEGRPGRLTLGDFLTSQITNSRSQTEKSLPQTKQSCPQTKQACPQTKQACPQTKQSTAISSSNNDITNEVDNFETEDGCQGNQCNDNDLLTPRSEASTSDTAITYFVWRTKKGGLPVKVENRASGKKVTLIENVKGEGKLLVHQMKMKFGTGGLFKDGTIELQGDLKLKVTKFLNENKNLLKPYGTK